MARSWHTLRGVAAVGSAEQVLAGLHRGGSIGVADRVRVQLEDEPRRAVPEPVLGGPVPAPRVHGSVPDDEAVGAIVTLDLLVDALEERWQIAMARQ